MKAIRLKAPASLDNLTLTDIEKPAPGPRDILVKAHASSLNYHDYVVCMGGINTPDGRIPLSDVAGEVVETGSQVTAFKPGDKVIGIFFPKWQSGEAPMELTWDCIPGDTAQGYASEFVCADQTAFTPQPEGYSMEEAATLPCAGVTAWRALFAEGGLKAGETVLIQGTGGVSIFALQLAKAAGATVIATSSRDEKLKKLKALGADHVINYKDTPDWGKAAAKLCARKGVDHVVEIGGAGTLAQSIEACRNHGHISMIGVLAGRIGEVPTAALMKRQIKLKGITVGSREHQLELVSALEATGIKPVIDRSFPLEQIAQAFRYQESQQHFGKICLSY